MEQQGRNRFSAILKRDSQQSKATSTPRTANTPTLSISPSISSISNNEESMEVDESDTEVTALPSGTNPDNIESSIDETSSVERPARRVKKITWTGVWCSFKPKNRDSLYFKIMSQPNESESIVVDFFHVYSKNQKQGVAQILQLLVDLCGYKKIAVELVYAFEEGNCKELVDKMESELMETELRTTGRFIFMKDSRFVKTIEVTITHFLLELISIGFKSEILFDGVFLGHLLDFVNCMSFSSLANIRVTGVIIGLKLLTAFVNLYKKLLDFVRENSIDESSHASISEKETTIENCIDFLYMIYDKNCLLVDKKCFMIKLKCVQEMQLWINLFPETFIIKRRCLGRLMKLLLDPNETVRKNALNICEKLIASESDKLHDELKNRIELCLKLISTRFLDVNYQIAIKAVAIFTDALDRYSEHITKEYKLSIIQLIYHQNVALAKTAGKFIVTYLRTRNRDEEQFLLSLSKIAFLRKEFAERLPSLIESCIEYSCELQNWNVMVTKILLAPGCDLNTKKHVLEIMKESVRYFLTGRCSNSRTDAQGTPQPLVKHFAVATVLVPHFENLVTDLQEDRKCLGSLIEILTFINFNHCQSEQLNSFYTDMVGLLSELFRVTTNHLLMENICSVFYCFCEKQLYNRARSLLEILKNDYVKTITDDLQQLTPDSDKNLLIRLRDKTLKASILFSKFNLTKILKWEDIFDIWNNNYLKVLKYLIVCCKWHLVWSLRQLIQSSLENNNDVGNGNHLFRIHCKEFVYGCLDILKKADDSSLSYLIFDTLCDFYKIFGNELRRKRQFASFIVEISEPDVHEIFFKFLVNYVIYNEKLSLEQRQKYFCDVVDVMCLNTVPVECGTKILQFYHTHSEEFGTIIDHFLKQLHLNHPGLPLMIMHTMAELYNQILEQNRIVDISSEACSQLKSLVKKFAFTKVLKSQDDTLKLVNMAIRFGFRGEQNYPFLYFAKYFVKTLKEDLKSDAYHLFREIVPEKDKNNDMVLLFARSLKPST